MAAGLLEISGTMDPAQFWPGGGSDADTVKLTVSTAASAFRFRPHPGAAFRNTKAFRDATVVGRVRKKAIDAKGALVLRLQGVDAPELHYRPEAAVDARDRTEAQADAWERAKGDFRQPFGETAAREVGKVIATVAGGAPLPCIVLTAVDSPGDAFDTYGRLVGDVFFKRGAREIHLNTWLAREGWAVPTFYASMNNDEIAGYASAAKKARDENKGLWPSFSRAVSTFDRIVYRSPKVTAAEGVDAIEDQGKVIMPKLFRRVSTWAVNKKGKMVTGSFEAYLVAKKDACYATANFLEQGAAAATPRRLDEFVGADGRMTVGPEGVVFQEKPSRVLAADGTEARW